MAFLIYKKSVAGANILYERLMPLKLGGRAGLIASHVKTLPSGDTDSWNLATTTLLKRAGFAANVGELAVLFDVSDYNSTCVCLYELIGIHGSCRDTTTQLALDFAVLVDQAVGGSPAEYVKSFEIRVGNKPKLLGETLALSGGPGGGDWKWTETAMNLGVTVVQAQASNTTAV